MNDLTLQQKLEKMQKPHGTSTATNDKFVATLQRVQTIPEFLEENCAPEDIARFNSQFDEFLADGTPVSPDVIEALASVFTTADVFVIPEEIGKGTDARTYLISRKELYKEFFYDDLSQFGIRCVSEPGFVQKMKLMIVARPKFEKKSKK